MSAARRPPVAARVAPRTRGCATPHSGRRARAARASGARYTAIVSRAARAARAQVFAGCRRARGCIGGRRGRGGLRRARRIMKGVQALPKERHADQRGWPIWIARHSLDVLEAPREACHVGLAHTRDDVHSTPVEDVGGVSVVGTVIEHVREHWLKLREAGLAEEGVFSTRMMKFPSG